HRKAMYMWAGGASQSEIANALGMTTCQVAGRMNRNREDFPKRNPEATKADGKPIAPRKNSVWTEARLKTAASLWKAGWTEEEVADALDVSKAAFVQVKKRYKPMFSVDRNRQFRARRPRLDVPDNLDELFEQSEGKAAADGRRFILAGVEPVAFVDLRANQCRFPVSSPDSPNGPAMPCCGAPRAEGRPYCAAHAVISRRRDAS
ncbi:MAG TPA: GcrA family cell cycle regulator, partial [Sinorhizobium sp.]|nr:GcrA family cell cycle regulator [Sinorhizobium sp.]